MSIVVTGGAGRLGRTVVSTLAEQATRSSRSTGSCPGCRRRRREVAVDLTDHDATVDALRAASGRTPSSTWRRSPCPFSAPEDVILRTNTALAWTVLEAAAGSGSHEDPGRAAPPPSSATAHRAAGRRERSPSTRTHPVAPWNAYALSKLVIE